MTAVDYKRLFNDFVLGDGRCFSNLSPHPRFQQISFNQLTEKHNK